MMSPYDVLPDELASRVKDTGDCWEWTGAFRKTTGTSPRSVPRLGEILVLQEIYKTVETLSKNTAIIQACENPACVHPEHLTTNYSDVGLMLRIKRTCNITPDGCWLWEGRTDNGQPYTNRDRKRVNVLRFVYAVERGLKVLPATTGKAVQTCGNANCVSYKHIELDLVPDTCSEGHRLGKARTCRTCEKKNSREQHRCPRAHVDTYWDHLGYMCCDACNKEDAKTYLRETSKDFLARWG